tara:strand:+ start:437 stop:829 length:393 start_codon:yes stop_codon:yes gene_type:complete
MTAKIAKGKLVRLNPTKCFTTRQGGGLQYPRTNYNHDEAGTVPSSRPTTLEEQQAWYQTDAAKGMTSAGESKLPPQSCQITLHRDRIYEVLRARCAVRLGWGNKTGGLAKVLCTYSGEETYIKRELLEVV